MSATVKDIFAGQSTGVPLLPFLLDFHLPKGGLEKVLGDGAVIRWGLLK